LKHLGTTEYKESVDLPIDPIEIQQVDLSVYDAIATGGESA